MPEYICTMDYGQYRIQAQNPEDAAHRCVQEHASNYDGSFEISVRPAVSSTHYFTVQRTTHITRNPKPRT